MVELVSVFYVLRNLILEHYYNDILLFHYRIFAKDLFYCIYTEPADSTTSQFNNASQ